jgi:phosphoglycerol transferase MdoB-like AlkP superfamily enzyme
MEVLSMKSINARIKFLIVFLSILWISSQLTRTILFFMADDKLSMGIGDFFHGFFVGQIYDFSFIFYVLLLLTVPMAAIPTRIWNSKLVNGVLHFLIFSEIGISLFVIVAEILFWKEFQSRFNFIAVDYLIYTHEVLENIVESYPIFQLVTWIIVIAAILSFSLRSIQFRDLQKSNITQRGSLLGVIFLIALIPFFLVNQSLRDFSESSYLTELCSNGPYQFFAAFRNNEMDFKKYYSAIEDKDAVNTIRPLIKAEGGEFVQADSADTFQEVKSDAEEKKYNVILVQIESMSADFLGIYGNGNRLTPFLDGLSERSINFTNCYATGTRTTRGLEAISLSLPPMPGRSIIKRIGREKDMITLGGVLNKHGYKSKFIYGGRGFFDNMNAFFEGNGYDIIDQHSTPSEEIGFANAWGMADEYLYNQVLKSADKEYKEQPFFYHVMTTSNHRPYTYPEGRIDIPSGTGRNGAVKYADWALGNFMEEAKTHAWFENTIFIVVADHQASSAGKVTLPLQRYHIPLMIYAPKIISPDSITKVCSQIDIPTTLLAMMHLNYKACFFGRDILSDDFPERAFIGTYQSLGYYVAPDLIVMSPIHKISDHRYSQSGQVDILYENIPEKLKKEAKSFYKASDLTYRNRLNSVNREEWRDGDE